MATTKRKDRDVIRLLDVLKQHYLPLHPKADIQAYRYNSASIRVRVIEPTFAHVGLTERDDEIWNILKSHLSEDILSQLSLILLIAPNERKTSVMNEEFENPIPSRL
jgi:hypothetical protein